MNTKILKLIYRFKILAALAIFLLSVFAVVLPAPKAEAAGEQYMYYFSQNFGGLLQNMTSAEYEASFVFGRSGVYGRDALRLSAVEQGRSTGSSTTNTEAGTILQARAPSYYPKVSADGGPFGTGSGSYLGHYKCKGITVSILVGITSALKPNLPLPSGQQGVNAEVWILGSPSNGLTGEGVRFNYPTCMPSTANTTKNLTNNSVKNTVMPTYFGLETKKKQSWFNTLKASGYNVEKPAPTPPRVLPGDGEADADAAGDDETPACGTGLSLGWIICGITEAVQSFGDWVFKGYIQPMMEKNPLSTNPKDPFYQSWQGFRFLANILLIVSLLAVVYSQTRGGSS